MASEGLLSVLGVMLDAGIESYNIAFNDLKSLRMIKGFKERLDPVIFRKMKIKLSTNVRRDTYLELKKETILHHVYDLELCRSATLTKTEYNHQKKWVLTILRICAPRLQRLKLAASLPLSADRPLVSNLLLPYNFSNLKTLELQCSPVEIMEILLQNRLYSMRSIEKLILSSADGDPPLDFKATTSEHVNVIAHQTPFLATLVELELRFPNSVVKGLPALSSCLTALVLHGRRLQILKLHGMALQIGNALSIEEMHIRGCIHADKLVFPRSLVRLHLFGCFFSSSAAALAVLNSTNLPRLTTLRMKATRIGGMHGCKDFWIEFLQRLDLPALEDLAISRCPSLPPTAVFFIAIEESNLPCLKRYCVVPSSRNSMESDHINPSFVRTFAESTLAAKLECLELPWVEFAGEVLQIFEENASNMPNLQCLAVAVKSVRDLQNIAAAGRRGHWRMLRKINLYCYVARSQPADDWPMNSLEDCCQYSNDLLDPIFGPDLDLVVEGLLNSI